LLPVKVHTLRTAPYLLRSNIFRSALCATLDTHNFTLNLFIFRKNNDHHEKEVLSIQQSVDQLFSQNQKLEKDVETLHLLQLSVDQLSSKNQRLEKEVETLQSQNFDINPPSTFSEVSEFNPLPYLSDNEEEHRFNDIVVENDIDNERRPKEDRKGKKMNQEVDQKSNEDNIPKAKKAKNTIGCCTLCNKEMKLSYMQQHLDSHQKCSICNLEYSGRSASARRKQHEKTCRPKIIYKCNFCPKILRFKSIKKDHEKTCRHRAK
jgi:FtsZ-binding cell division protein ZapB